MNKWLKIIHKCLVGYHYLPCHCLFCLEPSGREIALCPRCEEYLPWLSAFCDTCALPLVAGQTVCGQCLYQVPPYERLQALFDYQWPLTRFISNLKFHGQLHFAKMLGSLMNQYLTPLTPVDCIVPVPLHPKRQQSRGFNQTLEIAKVIATRKNLLLDKWSASKIIHTEAQSGLSAKKRSQNISERAFAIHPNFQAKHVLVIEDVVTTGATVEALTKALKRAGAETVEIWACCRTGIT